MWLWTSPTYILTHLSSLYLTNLCHCVHSPPRCSQTSPAPVWMPSSETDRLPLSLCIDALCRLGVPQPLWGKPSSLCCGSDPTCQSSWTLWTPSSPGLHSSNLARACPRHLLTWMPSSATLTLTYSTILEGRKEGKEEKKEEGWKAGRNNMFHHFSIAFLGFLQADHNICK